MGHIGTESPHQSEAVQESCASAFTNECHFGAGCHIVYKYSIQLAFSLLLYVTKNNMQASFLYNAPLSLLSFPRNACASALFVEDLQMPIEWSHAMGIQKVPGLSTSEGKTF